mmetsp:Transcript_20536/g.33830  ORF Transcript_20536/g.33830 Transcript_20536/m.33830 type:complete len:338 (+) Transcript_20536:260-1273(+)
MRIVQLNCSRQLAYLLMLTMAQRATAESTSHMQTVLHTAIWPSRALVGRRAAPLTAASTKPTQVASRSSNRDRARFDSRLVTVAVGPGPRPGAGAGAGLGPLSKSLMDGLRTGAKPADSAICLATIKDATLEEVVPTELLNPPGPGPGPTPATGTGSRPSGPPPVLSGAGAGAGAGSGSTAFRDGLRGDFRNESFSSGKRLLPMLFSADAFFDSVIGLVCGCGWGLRAWRAVVMLRSGDFILFQLPLPVPLPPSAPLSSNPPVLLRVWPGCEGEDEGDMAGDTLRETCPSPGPVGCGTLSAEGRWCAASGTASFGKGGGGGGRGTGSCVGAGGAGGG